MLTRTQEFECETIAEMFENSYKLNVNPSDLAKKLLTDEWGISVFMGKRQTEYADPVFMLSGMVKNAKVKHSKEHKYDKFQLWFIGYLYKYWYEVKHTNPKKIYEIAPFKELIINFDFYHTQSWDYLIKYLTDRHKQKEKCKI